MCFLSNSQLKHKLIYYDKNPLLLWTQIGRHFRSRKEDTGRLWAFDTREPFRKVILSCHVAYDTFIALSNSTEIPSQDVNGMIVGLCVGFGVLIVLLLASWKFTKGKNYRMRLRVAYGNFRFGNRVTPDGKAHKLYETEEKPDLQVEEGEDTGNNVNATGV